MSNIWVTQKEKQARPADSEAVKVLCEGAEIGKARWDVIPIIIGAKGHHDGGQLWKQGS